jgi:Holliday junction resolvase RusA-like endonuclease
MYIDYDFPNWNKYIDAERTNKYYANNMKQQEKRIVKLLCRNMEPITQYPIRLKIKKYVKNKNTDVDNIRIKGLLDGLVDAGIIKNDNLNYISEIILKAEVSKNKTGIDLDIEYI